MHESKKGEKSKQSEEILENGETEYSSRNKVIYLRSEFDELQKNVGKEIQNCNINSDQMGKMV